MEKIVCHEVSIKVTEFYFSSQNILLMPPHYRLCSLFNVVTIQHEFMHAMGFEHEHTRPDRNQYVAILTQNIENRKEREHNFDRHDDSQTLGSPYDYNSIMHYSGGAFSIGNTKTIVPKNGAQIGQPEKASDSDIKKLKLLYQCEKGIVRDCKCIIYIYIISQLPMFELVIGEN